MPHLSQENLSKRLVNTITCNRSLFFAPKLRDPPEQLYFAGKTPFARLRPYWPRCSRAVRRGSLGIRSSPSNGRFNSTIRKIAPVTESAQTKKAAMTVALGGAKRPKPKKI